MDLPRFGRTGQVQLSRAESVRYIPMPARYRRPGLPAAGEPCSMTPSREAAILATPSRARSRRCLLRVSVRRVAAVQHELVALGVGEDRHVADAGVEGVAEEGHALGLELRAGRVDVLHAQWQRIAGLGDELHPDPLGLPDDEAGAASPLLVLRVLIGTHAEDVAVEAARAPGVLRGDADEVELLDECHARESVNQP